MLHLYSTVLFAVLAANAIAVVVAAAIAIGRRKREFCRGALAGSGPIGQTLLPNFGLWSGSGAGRLARALSRCRRSVAVNVVGNRRHAVADAAAQVRNEPARSSLKCGRRSR